MKHTLRLPSFSSAPRPFRAVLIALAASLALTACAAKPQAPLPDVLGAAIPAYDYPFDNPYAATVLGTPPEQRFDFSGLPEPDPQTLVVYPNRKIPEGFWYHEALHYSQMLQEHPAPVVFVIAGTGADHRSAKTLTIARALYAAGNHVVLLPSPTHANFIVTASKQHLPGNPYADAADLYKVITLVLEKLKNTEDLTLTGTSLTGYSLGGWNAAYVAKLDEVEGKANFQKVLLINPPLSLYESVRAIDRMLYRGLPEGLNGADAFIDRALSRLSAVNQNTDALDFTNENLLIEAYKKYNTPEERLATTVGLSFRLSAANMVFTSDVMRKANYIFPADQEFKSTTPLNDYFAVALRTSFVNYFDDMYTAAWVKTNPELTTESLIAQSSLTGISTWLHNRQNISVIGNADDVILSPADLKTMQTIFGNRAYFFPTGGHMGNLDHRAFVSRLARYFHNGHMPENIK